MFPKNGSNNSGEFNLNLKFCKKLYSIDNIDLKRKPVFRSMVKQINQMFYDSISYNNEASSQANVLKRMWEFIHMRKERNAYKLKYRPILCCYVCKISFAIVYPNYIVYATSIFKVLQLGLRPRGPLTSGNWIKVFWSCCHCPSLT